MDVPGAEITRAPAIFCQGMPCIPDRNPTCGCRMMPAENFVWMPRISTPSTSDDEADLPELLNYPHSDLDF